MKNSRRIQAKSLFDYNIFLIGFMGAGKSTIARAAARRFGLIYVDTGAIYRTVGLAGERAGVNCSDAEAMQALLPALRQMVYQAEKTLNEVGDKVPESEKAPIQAGIDKLKETLKGEDSDAIKAATEELTQLFYKMSEKLYQQQAPQGDPNMGGQQPGGDPNGGQQYYDADYKVVDDDDQNK